ncbi:MAG: dihydrodipicolinate synthase family protein [Thermomicrobiales bacterium]|nr:dihydrodipicolinate synthase family protein [Thermomicrobiales bacterium]
MFRGIIPPTVTFFKEDGALDTETNRSHIDFLIEAGVHGLFVLGTTGEFMHMSPKEREQHAAEVVQHVNGRIPVILGTGTLSTRETVRLSRHAQGIGADAVAIVTPYFWTLSEREVIAHLSAVANAVDIPVVIYNFPAYSNYNVSSETLAALVKEHGNIAGVKDTIDSLEHLRRRVEVVKEIKPDFSVLAGGDGYLLPLLEMGGDGSVPATANVAPARHVAIFDSWERGDYATALEALPALEELLAIYRVPGSFHSVIKEAMAMAGVAPASGARLPALPLTADSRARLREALASAGLLAASDDR